MSRYVLNSAVLTTPGTFQYRRLTIEEARKWLAAGPFQSAVSYIATAEAMGLLLGERPVVTRAHIKMAVGDEALVFRLTMSISYYEREFRSQHNVTPDFVANNAEIGLMRRID